MMHGWDMTGWGWLWMTLMMGGGTALLVLLIVLLTRAPAPGSRRERLDDPKGILACRFARGEIDEAEYRRRLDALRSGTS